MWRFPLIVIDRSFFRGGERGDVVLSIIIWITLISPTHTECEVHYRYHTGIYIYDSYIRELCQQPVLLSPGIFRRLYPLTRYKLFDSSTLTGSAHHPQASHCTFLALNNFAAPVSVGRRANPLASCLSTLKSAIRGLVSDDVVSLSSSFNVQSSRCWYSCYLFLFSSTHFTHTYSLLLFQASFSWGGDH